MRTRLMKTKLTVVLMFVAFGWLTMAPSCGKEGFIRTAAKVANLQVIGLQATRDTNQSLLRNGQITTDEADAVTRKLQIASPLVRRFNDEIQVWQNKLNADPTNAKTIDAEANVEMNDQKVNATNAVNDVKAAINAVTNSTAKQALNTALDAKDTH